MVIGIDQSHQAKDLDLPLNRLRQKDIHMETINMRELVLILSLASSGAQAQSIDAEKISKCKEIALEAKAIMQDRQSRNDMYASLEKYPDKPSLVLSAYEVPFYDVLGQLKRSVDAIGKRSASDENRKYDELASAMDNAISKFEVNAFKKCVSE